MDSVCLSVRQFVFFSFSLCCSSKFVSSSLSVLDSLVLAIGLSLLHFSFRLSELSVLASLMPAVFLSHLSHSLCLYVSLHVSLIPDFLSHLSHSHFCMPLSMSFIFQYHIFLSFPSHSYCLSIPASLISAIFLSFVCHSTYPSPLLSVSLTPSPSIKLSIRPVYLSHSNCLSVSPSSLLFDLSIHLSHRISHTHTQPL